MFENDCGVMQMHMQLEYGELYYPKPKWCPLKPMPEKKNEKDVEKIYSINDRSWTNGFSDGYNYCINEILGEE